MPVRLALVFLVCACDPSIGPFRVKPPQRPGLPVCGNLPALAADAEPPLADVDIDGDQQSDYIAVKPGTCDADGNCDHDLYVVRESCAVAVGTIRAHTVKGKYGLVAVEHVTIGGRRVERETTWDMDVTTYRYKPRGEPTCNVVGEIRSGQPCSAVAVPSDAGVASEDAGAQ